MLSPTLPGPHPSLVTRHTSMRVRACNRVAHKATKWVVWYYVRKNQKPYGEADEQPPVVYACNVVSQVAQGSWHRSTAEEERRGGRGRVEWDGKAEGRVDATYETPQSSNDIPCSSAGTAAGS